MGHRNKNDRVIAVQAILLSKVKDLSALTIGRRKLKFVSVPPTLVYARQLAAIGRAYNL